MRLLKFTLLLSIAASWKINASPSAPAQCNNATTFTPNALERFRNVALTRRTRALLFPENAFVLISPAFTKAIIDGRPTGLSYSIEFDMYSKVPDTIESLKPKPLIYKANRVKAEELKDAQQQVKTPPSLSDEPKFHTGDHAFLEDFGVYDDYLDHHDHNVWDDDAHAHFWPSDTDLRYTLPTDLWANDVDIAPYSPAEQWRRKYDFNGRKELERFYQSRRQNYSKASTHGTNILRRFHTMPMLQKQKYYKNKYNNKDWTPRRKYDKYKRQKNQKYANRYRTDPNWKYYANYRERREIFEQLETVGKIFNFDMKACIQRAMCEMTTYLRPYGESLMEDLLRIILTVPRRTDMPDEDDYDVPQHAKHANKSMPNCAQRYMFSCPYAVMDLLTKNLRQNHYNAAEFNKNN